MSHKLHINKKRIIYSLCFFMFCLIDQRTKTGSGLDGWIETFRNSAGIVMAVLILSHYHLNDFIKQKIPYLVWSLICVIGGVAFIGWGQSFLYFVNGRISLVLSVFFMGLAGIRTFIAVVYEKKLPRLNRTFGVLWLVMMALMVISRSAYLWPLAYLVMFGCFYLTDYSKEEQEDLTQGMLNGIILAFFMLQGWCFAFRPYDVVRYVGVYSNCNMNALFYLTVLSAALAKLLYTYRRDGNRWWKVFYFLGTGVVLGFLFMTISRTGWFVAVLMVLAALVGLWRMGVGKNIFVSVVRNGLIVVLCFALMFPVVFGAVRYLPPMFHHPVWFFGEWNEDKVHSWDKWDSEKFINIDKLMKSATGRVADVFESLLGGAENGAENESSAETVESTPHLEVEGVNMAELSSDDTAQAEVPSDNDSETATGGTEPTPLQQQLYDEAYEAGFALDVTDRNNPIKVRTAIYRFYAHLLNLTGHPESEQGFQIFPTRRIGHAHNIYLQYGVDFGIPVLVLFVVLMGWSVAGLWKRLFAGRTDAFAGDVLILMVPATFGLLEYCWGSGSAAVILLFVVWRRMICNEREI